MLNRWVEEGLLDTLDETGVGCIAFSPLAQGMLTSKYLNGIPDDSRAAQGKSLSPDLLTNENLAHIRALNQIAASRHQTLAQLALAWVLRRSTVTSALVGASSVKQLEDSVAAVANITFTDDELKAIDEHATDGGLNLWAGPSSI
jgi:L-glyceraldehyde 3-phosphate reductase